MISVIPSEMRGTSHEIVDYAARDDKPYKKLEIPRLRLE